MEQMIALWQRLPYHTDVGGVDRPGKGGAAFHTRPHERPDIRRNLVVILIQNDCYRHGRKIIAAEITPLLCWIIRMRFHLQQVSPPWRR
jgi:hypothetical protein